MTNLEVEIISRETSKPSSPTPPHLRTFNLCLLDQMSPTVYPPLVFYYPRHPVKESQDPYEKLKTSLSEALTRFYPLAGRIKDNLFVDCNDDGVLCLSAKVNCPLSEILKQPQIELLYQFLPLQVAYTEPLELAVLVAVQINLFSCGGIAVGVSGLHKIIDATTISAFLKHWAAIASGMCAYKSERVDCVATSLFPAREPLPTHASAWLGSSFLEEEKSSTRRFVFNAEAISKLKAKAKSEAVPNPTAVEAISGFIWKRLMNASKQVSESPKPSLIANLVNLRQRLEPPLPEDTVGNIIWKVFSVCQATEMEMELPDLVAKIRNSFAEIKKEYVQKLVGEDGIGAISKWLEEVEEIYSNGKPISYGFSSMRNMGLSEMDFGWGKPAWISFKEVTECRNIVTFIETRGGGGIEAWISLAVHELFILENDQEMLALSSLNPGIPNLVNSLDEQDFKVMKK